MHSIRRMTIMMLAVGAWPQVGCLHWQSDKASDDVRPLNVAPKNEVAKKEPIETSRLAAAEALEKAYRVNEAIVAYEKLRESPGPDYWPATRRLAFLYLNQSNYDRAEQEYRRILQSNPTDLDAISSIADISYRQGRFGTAEKLYRDVLSRKPDHAGALSGLGYTLAHTDQLRESADLFTRLLASKAEAHCHLASVLKRNRLFDAAASECEKALAADPGSTRARSEIAWLYEAMNRSPANVARLPAANGEHRGVVEVEPIQPLAVNGSNRIQKDRPTLPPLPEFELNR